MTNVLSFISLIVIFSASALSAMESNNNNFPATEQKNEDVLTTSQKRHIHLKEIKKALEEWDATIKQLKLLEQKGYECTEKLTQDIIAQFTDSNNIYAISISYLPPHITYSFKKNRAPFCKEIVINKHLFDSATFNKLQQYMLTLANNTLNKLYPNCTNDNFDSCIKKLVKILEKIFAEDFDRLKTRIGFLLTESHKEINTYNDAYSKCIEFIDELINKEKVLSLSKIATQTVIQNTQTIKNIVTKISQNELLEDLVEQIIQETSSKLWIENCEAWLQLLPSSLDYYLKMMIIERCSEYSECIAPLLEKTMHSDFFNNACEKILHNSHLTYQVMNNSNSTIKQNIKNIILKCFEQNTIPSDEEAQLNLTSLAQLCNCLFNPKEKKVLTLIEPSFSKKIINYVPTNMLSKMPTRLLFTLLANFEYPAKDDMHYFTAFCKKAALIKPSDSNGLNYLDSRLFLQTSDDTIKDDEFATTITMLEYCSIDCKKRFKDRIRNKLEQLEKHGKFNDRALALEMELLELDKETTLETTNNNVQNSKDE